jgi:Tfp pilus assembly protein PilN
MRPVNLLPPEERRDKAPIRTGPIAYLLVGALAVALGAVTMLVLTNNKISDRKAEIASLKQQEAQAAARAAELAPFASFDTVEQQRTQTVSKLADSRFDWERVMRELALVIPSDVWLTQLTGTANGDAVGSSSATSGATSTATTVTGVPSLALSGCAPGQEAVAGFLSALRDIDGVTRVGLSLSEKPTGTAGAAAAAPSDSAGSGGGGADCRTRDFIVKFEIVAAFDNAPVAAAPSTEPAPAPAAPATTEAPATESAPASETTTTAAGQ